MNFNKFLLYTNDLPLTAPVRVEVQTKNGYNWSGQLKDIKAEILRHVMHVCHEQPVHEDGTPFLGFELKADQHPPQGRYFLTDKAGGKHYIEYCPFCGAEFESVF